ncbi:MAG: LamG domain-containing protein, partial [Anaerolineales bacterium]|nr:LamG domain-containing protein [Anaerolineales bacterium]
MVFPSSPRRRLGLLLALVGAVSALLLWPAPARSAGGYALRFYGHGVGDIDRVKVPVDDPATSLAGPPVDVGATDFTFEFWLKGTAAANSAPAVTCGANINWIYGNIVLDRDRYSQDRKFGVSLGAGRVVFGVSGAGTGDRTLCGTASLLDGQWHHVAVPRRRSDGWLWIYVDGVLQANVNGPDGDVSYPDDGVPGDFCGGPCVNSDPYLVLAAEKHDAGGQFPSFSGWLDE